ncbi:MAG: MFS transporter [Marinobacter sp.]|nr:MFS transporter [Marinobacter sp.]
MNAQEKRSVIALASVYAARMLGLFMVLPVFMLLGDELQGATPALLGLAIGAYGLSQALLQIPFGMLSDRFGRKRLIYFGLVLFALGSLVAAMSESIYGVIAGRILQGAGAIASVLMALLSDLTREEQRTKAMASVGISIGLAFAVSLVLGPLVAEVAGLAGIFYLTALLAVCAMVLVATQVPTPRQSPFNPETQPALAQLTGILRDKELLRLDAGIFVLHMVLTAMFLLVPGLLSTQLGIPVLSHWWVYLTVMVTSFVAMVPFIVLGEKKRQMKPVLCGAVTLLALGTGLAFLVDHRELASFWFALFLFFMAFNLLEASLPSLLSKAAPPASKGSVMGVYSTAQFMGAFAGGALGGLVLQAYGAQGVVVMMLMALAAWWLLAITMAKPRHNVSFVLQLERAGAYTPGDVDMALRSLPGVADVVILDDLNTAYLKIDREQFEPSVLDGLPFVQHAPR